MDRSSPLRDRRVCDVHIAGEERATLHAVIETVSSPLDIDTQLARVVDIATEATGCYAALVYLREGDRLVLRAPSPVHAPLVGRLAMGVGGGEAVGGGRACRGPLIRPRAREGSGAPPNPAC